MEWSQWLGVAPQPRQLLAVSDIDQIFERSVAFVVADFGGAAGFPLVIEDPLAEPIVPGAVLAEDPLRQGSGARAQVRTGILKVQESLAGVRIHLVDFNAHDGVHAYHGTAQGKRDVAHTKLPKGLELSGKGITPCGTVERRA